MTNYILMNIYILQLLLVFSFSITIGFGQTVTTYAGTGSTGTNNSSLLNSTFNQPTGIAIDANDNIFIAEIGSHLIRKITSTAVSTYAGSGISGTSDGTSLLTAEFNSPSGLAIDASNNIYIADFGNKNTRKIGSTTVSTLLGTYVLPTDVVLDKLGNLLIADRNASKIVKYNLSSNTISDFSNSTTVPYYNQPGGIAIDALGNVYVADQAEHVIFKIDNTGNKTIFAGTYGTPGFYDSKGINAKFNSPVDVDVDKYGNIYVADKSNYKIRKITPAGEVTTIPNGFTFSSPMGVAVNSKGDVFVADMSSNKIYKITMPLPKRRIWSGLGSAIDWSDRTNWVNNIAPNAGDTLEFGTKNSIIANNDYPNYTNFASIILSTPFNSSSVTITGNDIVLSGGNNAFVSKTASSNVQISVNFSFTTADPTITHVGSYPLNFSGKIDNNGKLLTVNTTSSIELQNIVSGSGSLTKIGSGALTLSGVNTFAGGMNLNQGTLTLGNGACLGDVAGIFTIGDGTTIDNLTGIGTINNPMVWNGSFTYGGVANGAVLNLGTGATTLNANITITTNKILTVGGIISGAYNIIHAGTSSLKLSATASNFTGTYSEQSGAFTYISTISNVNGGPSALGATTTVAKGTIAIGEGTKSSSFIFENAGSFSTDRIIDITSTTGGVFLTNNKANAYAVSFTSDFAASGSGTKTIFLTGSNTQNNLIAGKIPNPATGTIGVFKSGTGKWLLTGDNTFTGSTTASQGVLQIGNGGITGSLASTSIMINDTLIVDRSNQMSIAGTISGTGKFIKKSAGKLLLTANNTLTGPIIMNQGVLQLGNGGTTGEVASTSIILNDSLIVDRSNDLSVASIISGPGKLIKKSAGILTLTGANTYTGTTTITAGTLALGGTEVIANTSNIILNHGTFSTGTGVGFTETLGTLTLSDSAKIALGTGNHTLAFAASNGTTWTTGEVLKITGWNGNFDGTNTGASAHLITGSSAELTSSKLAQIQFYRTSNAQLYTATQLATGEIVPTATRIGVTNKTAIWDGGSAANDNWTTAANWVGDIAPIAGDTLVFDGSVRLAPVNDFPAGTSFAGIGFKPSAGAFKITGAAVSLSGGVIALTSKISKDSVTIGNNIVLTGANATFFSLASSNLIINGSINTNGNLLIANSDGAITINGAIAGTGRVDKIGTGSLSLNATNTFTGGVNLNQGTINLGNTNCLGAVSDTLTIGSGTTLKNTLGAFLILANYPMKWLGNFSFDAGENTNIGSGNIQLMGDVTISITNGLYLYNIISGNFSLTKAGPGQMQFMNSRNTYTGKSACIEGTTYVRILPNLGGISNFGQPTTNDNGTISLGAGSNLVSMNFISSNMVTDRVIDMAGTTGDVYLISNGPSSSINFSSNFTATGNGNKKIQFVAESKNNTVSGSIPNPVSGIISLNKSGLGKWTLSGNNTYTGTTTITKGVLQIGAGGTTGSVASTSIVINDTLVFNRSDDNTYAGIISGSGNLIKKGAGTLSLSGINTFTGNASIDQGTLRLGTNNAISTASIVLNGGTLATAGFSNTTTGSLSLTDNSSIDFNTGNHTLTFVYIANSFTSGKSLTINGWLGGYNASAGTGGKLFIGNAKNLSTAALAQIKFYRSSNAQTYEATQLSTGEIVPIASLSLPTITITGNTNALSTNHGTASATKTYSVAGTNLTDNIIIVAPIGYEIGLSELGTYGSTISFPPNNFEVLSTPFYLRISASTPVGTINASNIRGTSTGADTVYYAIPSGTVLSTILEQAKDTLACNGSLSTFIVKAVSGSSFQWQVNQGTGFVPISNSALYKGTDNDTLTITTVGIGMNKFQYRCLVNIDTSNIVTLNVKLFTTPTAIISGSDTICTGLTSSKIKIDLTGTSPWTIEYSKGAGSFPISNITTTPYYMSGIVYPTSINYSLVSVKDASNCLSTSSVSGNAFVKTVAKPAATIGVDTTICTGAEAKLHFNFTGSANFKVKYHDGLQYDSTYATSNSKTIAVSPTKTTTYNLVSVSTGNCTNTTTGKSATITVNTPPTASMTVLGSDVICNGASASLQLSITGPASTWTIEYSENGNKKTTPAFSTQNYTLLVNPSSDANYQLTAIRDLNCSAAIAPVSPINITVKSSGGRTSNPMIDQAGVYTCNANTLQLVVSNQETGAIYQWYRNGRLIIGANNDTLPVLTYGKYTLNEAYCRPSLSAYTIDSTVFGTAPVITTNDIGTKEGYLKTTAPVNASVQWYINDYKLEGETQEKLKISFNGTYKVSVTKANCTSFSLPTQILDQNYLDARLALVYHADSSVSFNDIHNSPYTVVPNPSKDEIHVLGPDMSQNYDIHIRDITGKLVYQSSNNLSKNTIHDIADLPTDIYIVELRIENQSYFVKFVKN